MSKHEELIADLRSRDKSDVNEGGVMGAAADALEAQAREIEGLQAARRAYASEFAPNGAGEPDVGSIHQNIRAMKAEIEGLRKEAERWRFAESAPSAITLRLHNLRPDQRAQYIDAAKGAPHG